MGDETEHTMNLDLNLGSFPSPDNEPLSVNFEDWIRGDELSEASRQRAITHWRSIRMRRLSGHIPPAMNNNIALELLETGEASVPADERIKKCDNNQIHVKEDEVLKKEDDNQKVNRVEGSFFDCNICLDLSKNPVVTCCGHLFCWTCLYSWLHVYSDARECPVCKGEVTTKMVTPIYGRGSNNNSHELEEDLSLKIPSRPQANRIESLRQSLLRNGYPYPVEEMLRRMGSRFDLTRGHVQDNAQGINDDRLLNSRGLPRGHNLADNPEEVMDLREIIPLNSEIGNDSRRLSSLLLRRPHAQRATNGLSPPSMVFSSAQSSTQPIFRLNNPVETNQDHQLISTEDRDSVSSIAAVIHSESHTFDNAVEIDSAISFSTSSSRRRHDGARVSNEIDSGDSRPSSRRRIN